MPKPVTVSVDVANNRDEVFAFLDVMANHEPFNNHLMREWEYAGPQRGVGANARVTVRALGFNDTVDIEVVDAHAPARIVERNTAVRSGRVGEGTYVLAVLPTGGTRVTFEYRWVHAPLLDRITAPMTRAYLRRNNKIAMRKLAELLGQTSGSRGAIINASASHSNTSEA